MNEKPIAWETIFVAWATTWTKNKVEFWLFFPEGDFSNELDKHEQCYI